MPDNQQSVQNNQQSVQNNEQPVPDNQHAADAAQAVQWLYEQYGNDVYLYARMTLGSEADAFDVVQEVFLRAFRAWSSFRRDANSRTWLMSISRNYLSDQLRKRQSERKHKTDGELPELVDPASSVDLVLEVQDALSRLKPTYRQAVVLRYIENFSQQETASILGWSEAKVRTTAHRAMKKLREWMRTRDEEDHAR